MITVTPIQFLWQKTNHLYIRCQGSWSWGLAHTLHNGGLSRSSRHGSLNSFRRSVWEGVLISAFSSMSYIIRQFAVGFNDGLICVFDSSTGGRMLKLRGLCDVSGNGWEGCSSRALMKRVWRVYESVTFQDFVLFLPSLRHQWNRKLNPSWNIDVLIVGLFKGIYGFLGHTKAVTAIAETQSEGLISASKDHTVRVWWDTCGK